MVADDEIAISAVDHTTQGLVEAAPPPQVIITCDVSVEKLHLGVSQNCGPHKRAERYSPLQCVLVVFHTFLSVT